MAPSDADMAPQFGLGKAPEVFSPVNVAAVTVGEHLRLQNQAVEITVSEQPGIAPESVQINRAATRDLLRDDLPRRRFRSPNSTNLPCAARLYRWLRTPSKQLSSTSTLPSGRASALYAWATARQSTF